MSNEEVTFFRGAINEQLTALYLELFFAYDYPKRKIMFLGFIYESLLHSNFKNLE